MRTSPFAVIGCLFSAVALSAQTQVVLPGAFATAMASTANRNPHSRHLIKQQQVFLGSEIAAGGDFVMQGLSLRQDETFVGSAGTYDYVIRIGPTALNNTNLTTNFAGNFSGPATTVFSGSFSIPAHSAGGGVNSWLFTIPFSTDYTHRAGNNLLVEWINTSTTSTSNFLDFCLNEPGSTTSICYAFDPNATTATSLDLNRGLVMRFTGHPPLTAPPCYETNLGTALAMTDDQTVIRPLGFAFPFPGGSTTSVGICSNGFVWLDGVQTNTDFSNSVLEFLGSAQATPRLAACWRDFNPAAAGSDDVYLNTFPDRAVITWHNVRRFLGTSPMTVQLQMLSDGSFYVFFDANFDLTGGVDHEGRSLIGIKAGTGVVVDPGNTDYSTALPLSTASSTIYEFFGDSVNFDLRGRCIRFQRNGTGYDVSFRTDCGASSSSFGTGCPAGTPLTLAAGAPPRLGSTISLDATNVALGADAGAMLFGVSTANFSLGALFPGCSGYTSADLVVALPLTPPTGALPATVPLAPGLIGMNLHVQAVAVKNSAPTSTHTSNRLTLTFGKN